MAFESGGDFYFHSHDASLRSSRVGLGPLRMQPVDIPARKFLDGACAVQVGRCCLSLCVAGRVVNAWFAVNGVRMFNQPMLAARAPGDTLKKWRRKERETIITNEKKEGITYVLKKLLFSQVVRRIFVRKGPVWCIHLALAPAGRGRGLNGHYPSLDFEI